jgi:hypothetical protein
MVSVFFIEIIDIRDSSILFFDFSILVPHLQIISKYVKIYQQFGDKLNKKSAAGFFY